MSERQSNSFENPLQVQTLNASTALTKDFEKRSKVIKKIEKRSKIFQTFILQKSELGQFGIILDRFGNF